jgi:hypothetical protein
MPDFRLFGGPPAATGYSTGNVGTLNGCARDQRGECVRLRREVPRRGKWRTTSREWLRLVRCQEQHPP